MTNAGGGSRVEVRLHKGPAGKRKDQRAVLAALGLRKRNQSAVHFDTPSLRGMVTAVRHLVSVSPAKGV